MPGRSRRARSAYGAMVVWVIALLVALVATIQLRSQAEVERSLHPVAIADRHDPDR